LPAFQGQFFVQEPPPPGSIWRDGGPLLLERPPSLGEKTAFLTAELSKYRLASPALGAHVNSGSFHLSQEIGGLVEQVSEPHDARASTSQVCL
jgi:hypothetical protein